MPHPGDIVFCKATNRVLLAADAVFDAAGNAYDPARVPVGIATHPYDGAPATEGPARPIPTGDVADSTAGAAEGLEGPSEGSRGTAADAEAADDHDAKLRAADLQDARRRVGAAR